MSKQQWGHGFYSGIASMQKKAGFPVGFYFLGEIPRGDGHQGKVTAQNDGKYLVQFFSWIDGSLSPTVHRFLPEDMNDFLWFETDKELRTAADAYFREVILKNA
jgi:hypothetical protein